MTPTALSNSWTRHDPITEAWSTGRSSLLVSPTGEIWNTRPPRHTKSHKLAQEALEIEAEEARAAGALGFMARILVQATLPHSRPRSHKFERINGRFTLYMNAPPSVGLPYGSYPRLALAWLSTEAVRTHSREIELSPTFSRFMYKLG